MLQQWWSKIENNTAVMCFIIYFQFGVWGRPESLNLLWRKLLWQRKWYLRKKLTIFEYRRERNISIYIWLTFSLSNFSWIKQSHLEEFSNTKLRAWILVYDRALRNKADFASPLNNVSNVKIYDLLVFVVILLFSSICCYLKIACSGDIHF